MVFGYGFDWFWLVLVWARVCYDSRVSWFLGFWLVVCLDLVRCGGSFAFWSSCWLRGGVAWF